MDGAIVLFAHGARGPDWSVPLVRLRAALEQAAPGLEVRIAYLEMQGPGLPEVLDALAGAGAPRISIAPVFWSRGGHVARDLPDLLAHWSARYPAVSLQVLPALSDLPGMDGFLAQAILGLAQPGP